MSLRHFLKMMKSCSNTQKRTNSVKNRKSNFHEFNTFLHKIKLTHNLLNSVEDRGRNNPVINWQSSLLLLHILMYESFVLAYIKTYFYDKVKSAKCIIKKSGVTFLLPYITVEYFISRVIFIFNLYFLCFVAAATPSTPRNNNSPIWIIYLKLLFSWRI